MLCGAGFQLSPLHSRATPGKCVLRSTCASLSRSTWLSKTTRNSLSPTRSQRWTWPGWLPPSWPMSLSCCTLRISPAASPNPRLAEGGSSQGEHSGSIIHSAEQNFSVCPLTLVSKEWDILTMQRCPPLSEAQPPTSGHAPLPASRSTDTRTSGPQVVRLACRSG